MVDDHRPSVDMVYRDVEKPLNLFAMEVHRHDPVGSGRDDQVGDQFGRDGHTRTLFSSILARITKVRNDGSDSGCG